MDDARVGATVRTVRVRRGWRQVDVARRAGAYPSAVSLIERGHLEGVSQRTLRRIAAALEVRIDILAFHPLTGSLLVIELKTEIVSIEDLLMTMDVRVRERHPQSRLTG